MKHEHTVLCVDDEEQNLHSLKRNLKRDFNVLTAASGAEGLIQLKKHPVDVIVTDQRMPNMSGVEFLAKSIEISPKTMRIILTGFTDENDLIDAINTGRAFYFLTKPWDSEELREIIHRAITLS